MDYEFSSIELPDYNIGQDPIEEAKNYLLESLADAAGIPYPVRPDPPAPLPTKRRRRPSHHQPDQQPYQWLFQLATHFLSRNDLITLRDLLTVEIETPNITT